MFVSIIIVITEKPNYYERSEWGKIAFTLENKILIFKLLCKFLFIK